jgi:dihydroorotase-like cyclic amidohydrolase
MAQMPDYDLVVTNGSVVLPGDRVIRADIGIRGETIACIADRLDAPATKAVDAAGKHVFPGFIDPHVHIGLWVPFYEDLVTESRGAAAGGITTMMITMGGLNKLHELDPTGALAATPDTPVRYADLVPRMARGVEGRSTVDFTLRCILGGKDHIDEMEACYRLGIPSFKFFMTFKNRPDVRGLDDGLMYHALRTNAKMNPAPILQAHCENDELVALTTEEVKKSGMQGLRAWNAARPILAEEEAIARICRLARRTGSSIYIVHVTCAAGVEVIAEEQRKGTRVVGETCVHYLGLTDEMDGVVGKASPPLRTRRDVDALWAAIQDGVITCVGTDHVSRRMEKKEGDIWAAVAAWPEMEVLMPAMITHALEREIPMTTVAQACATNSARVFGLFPKKGVIAVGSDADLVVTDLQERRTVEAKTFYSASKFCPYDEMTLVGWPQTTILRGRVVFDRGTFAAPGGQWIRVTPGGVC